MLRVRHPMSGRMEIVEVVTAEAVDASDVAAATDAVTAQAVLLETLARATETGAELSVPSSRTARRRRRTA